MILDSRKRIVLLLTATIKPFNEKYIKIRSIDLRESDYYNSILHYLNLGFTVVFVENSLFKSERIEGLAHRFSNFEILKFASTKSHLGKGHGEKEIIDYAIANSQLMNSSDLIFKISGRYIVKNIVKFSEGLGECKEDIYLNFTRNLSWADSRIFIMKKDFYINHFSPFCDANLDEKSKIILERVYARIAHLHLSKGGTVGWWPCYPTYLGYDGSYGDLVRFPFLKGIRYQLYFKLKKFILKHIA